MEQREVQVLDELLLQVGLLVLVEASEVVDGQQIVARVCQEDVVEQATRNMSSVLIKRAKLLQTYLRYRCSLQGQECPEECLLVLDRRRLLRRFL